MSTISTNLYPAVFSPKKIRNLKLWLDPVPGYCYADTARTTRATNGGTLQSVIDRSGNGQHMLYNTTAPTWSNGNYINFDASTKQYGTVGTVNDFGFMHDGTGGTMVLPVRVAANVTTIPLTNYAGDNTNKGFMLFGSDVGVEQGRMSLLTGDGTATLSSIIQPASATNLVPNGTDRLLTFRTKSGATGGDVQLLVDTCPFLKTTTSVNFVAGASDAPLSFGRVATTDPMRGRVYGLLSYARNISNFENHRLAAWFNRNRVPLVYKRVAYLGDSITFGTGGIMGSETPYPTLIAAINNATYAGVNYSVSGAFTSAAAATASGEVGATNLFTGQWTPRFGTVTGGAYMTALHNKYVILAGINDIRATSRTSSQILADIDALTAAILSWSGNSVVLCTLCPADSYTAFAGSSTKRQTIRDVNAGILARASSEITVVDLFNSALNNGSGALAASCDSGDGLHPNQTGKQVIADLMGPVV